MLEGTRNCGCEPRFNLRCTRGQYLYNKWQEMNQLTFAKGFVHLDMDTRDTIHDQISYARDRFFAHRAGKEF